MPEAITIFHNPRCSKSRQTLQIIEDKGVSPKVVEYLKQPPSYAELDQVLNMLDIGPRELMRSNEKTYKELGLADIDDRDALIRAMVDHPILIERPIVIKGDKAVLGRPPENVLELV